MSPTASCLGKRAPSERELFDSNGSKFVESPEHVKQRLEDARRLVSAQQSCSAAVALPRKDPSFWSTEDDAALRAVVAACRGNWKRITAAVSRAIGRPMTENMCLKRWCVIRDQVHGTSVFEKDTDSASESTETPSACGEPDGETASASADDNVAGTSADSDLESCGDCGEEDFDESEDESDEDESDSDSGSEGDFDEVCCPECPQEMPAPEDLPSLGSAAHFDGTCRRCVFFHKGRCMNGHDCGFCHYSHEKRKRKNKKKSKAARARRAAKRAVMYDATRSSRFASRSVEAPAMAQGWDSRNNTSYSAAWGMALPVKGSGPPPAMSCFSSVFPQRTQTQMGMAPAPPPALPVTVVEEQVVFDHRVAVWVEGLEEQYQFDLDDLSATLGAVSVQVHPDGSVVAVLADTKSALQVANLDMTPLMGGHLRIKVGTKQVRV